MNSQLKIFILLFLVSTFACNRGSHKLNQNNKNKTTEVASQKPGDAEIIIEGTVISSNRGFYHNSIYSSCLVEVNTIFKGAIKEKVIEVFVTGGSIGDLSVSLSHGQIFLPQENSTAIFRINKVAENDYHKELIELTPFELYLVRSDVQLLYSDKNYIYRSVNIEKEIYQKLEKESGRKRKLIRAPSTFDDVAINYSTKNRLPIPNRKKGIVYKLIPIQDSKMEDHLGFSIQLASTNTAVYLQKGELIIDYNPEAFGDSIVSKGLLKYEIPRNSKKGYSAIPESFQVNLTEINGSRFKIEWLNTGSPENCLQITPHAKGIFAAKLYFKPQKMHEQMGIKMTALDSCNLQYDYSTNTNSPFAYAATQEIRPFSAKQLIPATITQISPDTIVQPLDTIQLIGKHFDKKVRIYLSSSAVTGHKRYRRVSERYITSRSDTLLQMIIPSQTLPDKGGDLSNDWAPITGKVKLVKGYPPFEVMSYSQQKLRIKE